MNDALVEVHESAAALATVGYATAQSTGATPTEQSSAPMEPQASDTAAMPNAATSAMPGSATSAAPTADMSATPGSTTTTTDPATGATTTTTTTTSTSTQTIPAPPTGVVELARPKGTVAPTNKQPDNAQGMANNVMTTGVTNGALLDGVRLERGFVHTHTLVMNSSTRTVREVRMKRPV